MGLVASELNAGADAIAGGLAYMSLHTADPTTTGANETSGGGYARQPVTWTAASSGPGGVAGGTQVTFTVVAGSYSHGGYWTAATGGTWLGGGALGATQTLSAAGQVKVTPSVTVS